MARGDGADLRGGTGRARRASVRTNCPHSFRADTRASVVFGERRETIGNVQGIVKRPRTAARRTPGLGPESPSSLPFAYGCAAVVGGAPRAPLLSRRAARSR